ncbi:DUF885 domain-containing protein [Psychrosphaera aestuarii]|uniref:DUF885 domain-containing protein n=1 Tax=Psychrosphaera aestuarii TaxID=1266052 RepID=UPI001FD1DD79|nr:DUF885 domain-containing protein [Psychrosphaera aestuarii]
MKSGVTSVYFKKAVILVISMLLMSCATVNSSASNSNKAFQVTADQVWQTYLKANPLTASYFGDSDSAAKLPDLSPEGIKANQQLLIALLTELKTFERLALSEQNQINLQILTHRLQNDLDQIKFKSHYMPLTAEGGFHTSLAFLPANTKLSSTTDIDNYLQRLKAFKVYFEQNIYWMKEGIKIGYTQPQIVLNGYEQSIDGLIASDPSKSIFYQPFAKLDFLAESERQEYQQKAKSVIRQFVNPAYQAFRDFMINEYTPNAKRSIGINSIPNGIAYYQNRAKHYTTTELTVEQIHQLGLDEVARIRLEMAKVIEQVGFEGSFSEFLNFLRTDPQFYATSPKQLLMEASYIAKKMDAELPKLFQLLPRTPYGVAPVPEHIAPKYTTGRYVSAAKDIDAGYYWVNTYALDRRPLYELEALTLHEAVPGHHLQISLTRELENTPKYRSSYYLSAFGEGWGLYSEWLGLEVGFYQDPYSNFGRLTYEMWRALRLVVDTGMHIKGWSRQQAIDYMTQNSALSAHNIQTEVDRYISWPGQALSYKIGEITIKKQRQKAEQALGAKFDVRAFHYHVLKNGSVTLSQLERQVQDYINTVNKN